MSTQLVHPGEYEVSGVFLLSSQDLSELDTLVAEAQKEVNAYVSRQLTAEVDRQLKRHDLDAETHREKLRAKVKDEYPFNRRKQQISVQRRSKNKLEGKSFAHILESPELAQEWPTSADIKLQAADAEVKVTGGLWIVAVVTSALGSAIYDIVTQLNSRN